MNDFIFILIFIAAVAIIFMLAGFIGHLLKLDDYRYSPIDHQFIKRA